MILQQEAMPRSRYNPIKLRGGEPMHITVMRGRGHGSEHTQIAEWEASQRHPKGSTEETPQESLSPKTSAKSQPT